VQKEHVDYPQQNKAIIAPILLKFLFCIKCVKLCMLIFGAELVLQNVSDIYYQRSLEKKYAPN